MLNPGDLVVSTTSQDLAVWKNHLGDQFNDEFLCEFPKGSVMLLLKVIEMPKENWVSSKWKKACYVLGENGTAGWVGSGWIKKMPTRLQKVQ
jgi:hypothetical protein